MTDIITQTEPEVKYEIKYKVEYVKNYYQYKVATDPEYRQKENDRLTAYIKKRYHEDPEYRAKRLEYQRAYDKEKRAKAKALKELKYIVVPCELCK